MPSYGIYKTKTNVSNLFLLIFISIILGACGAKSTSSDYDDELISLEKSLDEDYSKFTLPTDMALTEEENRVLHSIGEVDRNLTKKQLELVKGYYKNYLLKSEMTIERFMYRAIPYLDYTKKIFRDKNMPEELAYLAFIESGYNPWAVSRSGAVGMWQFMPFTGRHYGLTQDWWIDERRDSYKSTIAAANYLEKLYNDFDDWFLAIAAYNAGEGKIGRALKATGAKDFFELIEENKRLKGSLKIKDETIQYVPRYLAMTKIMRNFDKLGFKPEAHSFKDNKPIIPSPGVAVPAEPGTDLASIAKDLNMAWKDFSAYNPAFKRYITPPNKIVNFYVPSKLKTQAIASSKNKQNSGYNEYKIVKGDTLTKISRKTGVPVHALRQLNLRSEPLQIGARLRIPRSTSSNSFQQAQNIEKVDKSNYNYVMKKGDSLGLIAQKHGLSLKQLMAANPSIKNVRTVQIGQRIYIPNSNLANNKSQAKEIDARQNKSSSKELVSTVQKNTIQNVKTHIVKKGDTIYSITKLYGLSQNQLYVANPQLNSKSKIKIGQKINISNTAMQKPTTTYTVSKGDTFWNISKRFSMSIDELLALNNLDKNQTLSIGKKIKVYQN